MVYEDTIAYATPHPRRWRDTIHRWLCRRGSTSGPRLIALAILTLVGAVCQTQAQAYIDIFRLGEVLVTGSLILFVIEYAMSFIQ